MRFVVDLQFKEYVLSGLNSTLSNLESFIKRYHLSSAIKGVMLFFGFGLLYAIFWVFVEHLFWLSTAGRTIVFWSLIFFEGILFYRFVITPLLNYFEVKRELSLDKAAVLVGQFFPEIKDKLLNAIQLNRQDKTELMLASIEQKAAEFSSFSFSKAVSFKDNMKYLRYVIAPLLVLAPFYLFGKQDKIENTIKRIVDYQTEYSPPAPFVFNVLNDNLSTVENESFKLLVTTQGAVRPDAVQIDLGGQTYFLNKEPNGQFSFLFSQPQKDQQFRLVSANVTSDDLILSVVKAPQIIAQELILNFPFYTGLKTKRVTSFSNLIVPDGTIVDWNIKTTSTDSVTFKDEASTIFLKKKGDLFVCSKQIFSRLEYTLTTSNSQLKNYEALESYIDIIPDNPPTINIKSKKEDSDESPLYFYGQMTDDFGVSKLVLHYAPINDKDNKRLVEITSFDKERLDFFYNFPNTLDLVPDTDYELFFEVFDNDPYPKPNRTRSATFFYNHKSQKTINSERLNTQEKALQDLQKSTQNQNQQPELYDPILMLKQKNELSFNDRQNIKDVFDRQDRQEKMMQRFTETIKKSLSSESEQNEKSEEKKRILKRLEAQQRKSEANLKELEELRQLMDKLNKEELLERAEQLAKKNQTNQRGLEQMLELTKRYYVTQKTTQLKKRFQDLAKQQIQLSEELNNKNTEHKQKRLNKAFDDLTHEFSELRKMNNDLAKPKTIPETQKQERSVSQNQKQALKYLQDKESQMNVHQKKEMSVKAQKEQQKAAQKMNQIAEQISQQMASGGTQQIQEDISMLRQILDNLLLFSFEQEALMARFKTTQSMRGGYAENLVSQKKLRTHFEHIDDSLFVLSLRQPLISEQINSNVEEVYSNIDKSLLLFSENDLYRGIGAQQYALTSTNSLADILSDALNSMEMQMQMNPGQGSGEMQLPDIIMSQEELQQQAQGLAKRQQGQDEQGKNSSKIQPNSSGSPQQNGSNGKNGLEGEYSDSEESSKALFELYQKQQSLRQALSQALQNKGLESKAQSTINEMKKIEQMLLNQGVTAEAIAKMNQLKYQFLKLQTASKKQGFDQKRISNQSQAEFDSKAQQIPLKIRQQLNSQDVLNRESLPLRRSISKRVIDYFNPTND